MLDSKIVQLGPGFTQHLLYLRLMVDHTYNNAPRVIMVYSRSSALAVRPKAGKQVGGYISPCIGSKSQVM